MSEERPVELYEGHYAHVEADLYRAVRAEAFGEDLGQTSWITAAECDELAGWLGLAPGGRLLEVACGSGGIAARIAERLGVSVVGLDASEAAVSGASDRARRGALAGRLRFEVADADGPLAFPDASFDAVFCNDAINHFRDRAHVLREWRRVLRPGGRCLYTDPVVVSGPVTGAELAARSSIGFFLFAPLGWNERIVRAADLELVRQADLTEAVATTSGRWHDARAKRRAELVALEGEAAFDGLQRFLHTVHALSSERRLSRFAYLCARMA